MSKAKQGVPYEWKPEETFEITGQEFGLLRNLIGAVLSNDLVRSILGAAEGDKVMKRLFEDNIDNGKIYERVELINPSRPLVDSDGRELLS